MRTPRPKCVLLWALAIAAALTSSCGGGSGGSSGNGSSGGSGSSSSGSSANHPAPAVSYASGYYSFTNGVPAGTIAPSNSGGAATSWTVNPTLPAGLTFGSSDGSIGGTPTAGAAAASYAITATNAGGQSVATLTIAVSAAPVIDLGHGTGLNFLRLSGGVLLSQDFNGHWVLWNSATDQPIASATVPLCQRSSCQEVRISGAPYPVDVAGATLVIGTPNGLELRSSATGQLVAAVDASLSWWALATDGSYVCGGSTMGLTVLSPTGQVLLKLAGDYSNAAASAEPGSMALALGADGAQVIETILLSDGSATSGPTFQGQFLSWFADGGRFLTDDSTTNIVRVYSRASVIQDTKAFAPGNTNFSSARGALGFDNWFWTVGSSLNIYAVGASAMPAASYRLASGSVLVVQSGPTLAVLPGVASPLSVIDLSGTAPVKTEYPSLLIGDLSTFAATSSSQWVVGNALGVVLDGSSLSGTTRYFGYGQAMSIAGGTAQFAVATASGPILYFDSTTNSRVGSIDFGSSKLALSADGSVLAAGANDSGTDRTVNVYSLPSAHLLNSFPSNTGSSPWLEDWSLSPDGTVLGQVFTDLTQKAVPASGGAAIWTTAVYTPTSPGTGYQSLLSPDGTLAAFGPEAEGGGSEPSTAIFLNGHPVTVLTGQAIGWIDNGRLLVGNFDDKYGRYLSSTLYGPSGSPIGSPAIPDIGSFQVLTPQAPQPDLLYSPALNSIVSLSSGATTWTSASPINSLSPAYRLGAVAGGEIVFASGNLVLAEPH